MSDQNLLIQDTEIPDVKILLPKRFSDERGYFSETFSSRSLEKAGMHLDFVQDNQSLSVEVGTLRGLHYQTPPFAQAKLVRVLSGAIYDVAVDIRKGSPYEGQHVGVKLTASEGTQLLVPAGFAHGFVTLEPNTVVFYKVTAPYSYEHDRGIRWDDDTFQVEWPSLKGPWVLSEKDRNHPSYAEIETEFVYG